MQKKSFIAFITAAVMIITALGGLATITSFADDTETVYMFNDLSATEYANTGATILDDLYIISKGSKAEKTYVQSTNATITSPLGNAVNVTKALKGKSLRVTVHLNVGETVVEYYCGTDSAGTTDYKDVSMVIVDSDGTQVADESNGERKGGVLKPYTISYKATKSDDYTIYDTGDSNRTLVYAIAVTTADYTGGGTTTPTTTTNPTTTTDPSATAAAATEKPTQAPAATVDPATVPEIEITRAQGWLESAYVTWTSATAVDKFNVYVKPENGEYTKLDDELVRYYGSYYRADALGLAAGTYKIKVAPVIGTTEKNAKESEVVTVESYIREGFAFDSNSPHYNAAGVGAYKNDGTLKDGAKVLYITDANKDTVQFDVVTDTSKSVVTTCTGLGEILAAREKNKAETTPLAIRMIGQVEAPRDVNSAKYMQIKSTSNVTFEGVGEDATTYHWSFLVRSSDNVEIRNLAVMEFYDDGISLDTENYNCWVHNCDIFYGQNRGGDQKKGDGSLDVKSGSDYCSFSYNHFWDSGKTSLCGMKVDSYKGYHMTYYGNWFDHSDSRHPRVRGDQVHVYNNYYDGVSKYGVGACTGGSVYVEKNVFRNAVHPVLISKQGTDAQGDGTFSGEDGGVIKMYDNEIYGGISVIYASESNTDDFDAYLATTRDETVPAAYAAKQGGGTYTNFDTATTMYSYTPLETSKVVDAVKKYAGRVQNGDFTHTFNDAVDDALYDRDETLGNNLQNYKTTLKTEYTTAAAYPATSGTQPEEKETPAPFNPSEQATPKPNSGEGGSTGGGDTTTTTDMWRASDNAASIAADTVLKGSWLTLVGGGVEYKASGKAINGVSLAGNVHGPSTQAKPTLAEKGADGATLKFTPDKDGTIGVYFKLNSGKIFYILDSEATEPVLAFENTTGANDYFYKTAAVTAGKTYYAFADGSNAEYWAAEYTTQSAYSDDGGDDEPDDKPDVPAEPCIKIVATYDGTRLVSIEVTDAVITEAKYTETATTKTFYWKTLEGMEPVPDAITE